MTQANSPWHPEPPKHEYYKLTVSDDTEKEGDKLSFRIQLDHKLDHDLYVHYKTEDGSAKKYDDYKPEYGTIKIKAGQDHADVWVKSVEDHKPEGKENFYLKVWEDDKYVETKDNDGKGTIIDDDYKPYDKPKVYVHDSYVKEGNEHEYNYAKVKVTMEDHNKDVYVNYYTRAGEANDYGKHEKDYEPKGGTLHFKPGDNEEYIYIKIKGDNYDEKDEKFSVYLENSDHYKFGDNHAYVTIKDDDDAYHPTVVAPTASDHPLV